MKKYIIHLIFCSVISIINISCQQTEEKSTAERKDTSANAAGSTLRSKVINAQEQKSLTPDMVIQTLHEGNGRFTGNHGISMDKLSMVHQSSGGQYPMAVVLSCIDSRVPVEEIFDQGIGDLFVARVAGNIVDEDMLGSMEYGCEEAGAKLVVVLGHESCGAIKAAIEDVKMGNITALLSKIAPALKMSKDFHGEKEVNNHAYVDTVVRNNVLNSIEQIKSKSEILKEMSEHGKIKIVGAYYNLETGEVIWL
jgi:carbonic anhydrase